MVLWPREISWSDPFTVGDSEDLAPSLSQAQAVVFVACPRTTCPIITPALLPRRGSGHCLHSRSQTNIAFHPRHSSVVSGNSFYQTRHHRATPISHNPKRIREDSRHHTDNQVSLEPETCRTMDPAAPNSPFKWETASGLGE
jgi:hypothetical protein